LEEDAEIVEQLRLTVVLFNGLFHVVIAAHVVGTGHRVPETGDNVDDEAECHERCEHVYCQYAAFHITSASLHG